MNLEKLLLKHGAVNASGAEYQMSCPFHDDKNPSLSVNTAKGVFICFGCGERGKIGKLIRKLTNETVYMEAEGQEDSTKVEARLPEGYVPLWQKPKSQYARWALKYVLGRGITVEQLERFKIGYCGFGYFAGRLIIPVYVKGEMVTFIARDFTGVAEMKVKYPKGSRQSEALFGYDQMLRTGRLSKRVVLTEGWADALAVDRVLEDSIGVVALGSNRMSCAQANLLERVPEFVVLMDNDGPGRAGAKEVIGMLSTQSDRVSVARLTTAKDPAESTPAELKHILVQSGCFR